jgi:hypothetical protein
MIIRFFKHILLLGGFLVATLTACEPARTELYPATPIPTLTVTVKTYILATPYAQQPAAGICASFEGEMVIVTLNPDVPDPRCTKVRADQKLTVINQTQNTLQVTIGVFTASLEPGEKTIIDIPFGEYLALGVHQLQVSPCCGAELWLEGK